MLACTIGGAAIAEIQGLMHSFGRVRYRARSAVWHNRETVRGQSPASAARESPPTQVREFLELLDDPAVRDWLQTQRTANQAPRRPPPPRRRGSKGIRRADRDNPAALCFPRRRLPMTARRFRAGQRQPSPPTFTSAACSNPAAPGRVRRAGVRCRMAVLAGNHGDPQAHQGAGSRRRWATACTRPQRGSRSARAVAAFA